MKNPEISAMNFCGMLIQLKWSSVIARNIHLQANAMIKLIKMHQNYAAECDVGVLVCYIISLGYLFQRNAKSSVDETDDMGNYVRPTEYDSFVKIHRTRRSSQS